MNDQTWMSGLGEFHQGRVNTEPKSQIQKNQLKSWLNVWYQCGLDGTDLRPTRLRGDFVNPRHKKTDISRFIVISFIGRKRWYQCGFDGTDLRPTRLRGDFMNFRYKKTN